MKETRVLIYVRVSKRRGEQHSLANQERECREWCKKNGYAIVRVFTENGASAYKKGTRRPQFDEAMTWMDAKRADIFLVWAIDRFYRDGREFHQSWYRIESSGGQLASVCDDDIDTSTAKGRERLSAIAYRAEIESERRAERTSSWHRGNMLDDPDNGRIGAAVGGGWVPFGYDRPEPNVLWINEKDADVIRNSAAALLAGTANLTQLLRIHKPMSTQRDESAVRAKPLTAPGFRRVFLNPTTYGMRRDKTTGTLVKGSWEGILPRSQYENMVELLTNPDRRTNDTNSEIRHPLSGIMMCGRCEEDSPLRFRRWLNAKNHGARYQCGKCYLTIDAPKCEAIIEDELWERVTPDVWQGWRTMGYGFDPAVRDAIEQRIETINMRFLAGKYDGRSDEYDGLMDELNRQLAQAVDGEPLDIPPVDDIVKEWDDLSATDQRKVYRLAFDRIIVNACEGTYDPKARIRYT